MATGRIDEGTALSERAIRLDPLMANWHLNLAQALLVAGRDAEAVEPLQRWEELQARPNPFLGGVFDRLGRADDAARQIEALHRRGDTTVAGLLYLGATGAVDAFLAGRERAFEAGEFSPMALAEAYIVAERVDDALRMLEHAVALRDPRLAWITFRLPGILEFMRDPRAMEILRETGVAQFF